MSDIVLLASKDGSKVAIVACPICSRISRQILMNEYKNSSVASLHAPHTCPVCGTVFTSSSSAESAKYAGSYARYIAQGEQSYNADIKTAFSTTRSQNAQSPNNISYQECSTESSDRYSAQSSLVATLRAIILKDADSEDRYNTQGETSHNADFKTVFSTTRSQNAQSQNSTSSQEHSSESSDFELVLLKKNWRLNEIIAICPSCGRIIELIPKDVYLEDSILHAVFDHRNCRFCGKAYDAASNTECEKYQEELCLYDKNPLSYNLTAYKRYKRNSSLPEKGSNASEDTVQSEKSMFEQGKTHTPQTAMPANQQQLILPITEPVKPVAEKHADPTDHSSHPIKSPQQEPVCSLSAVDSVPIPKVVTAPDSGHSNKTVLKRKVDHWKKQLLDLSKRNKMINYRETKRATLKILEPEFTQLFNRLAVSEEELTFQRPIDKDSDLKIFSMLSLLETLSYPIPVHVGDIKAEGSLLERRIALNNLRSKSKLARDEQGTNILYLSFGFIEWRESNSANAQWLKSPVLMMPVSLKLASIQAPYTLLRYDDDIEVNPTLDYLFNERYGIDLPTFELNGEESIEQYMQTIEEFADQHGWKLIREVSLGLLSFLKISMYHDLNNNYERMLKNPVVRAITGDANVANNIPQELTGFDFDRISPNDCYQVVNSDSSQQEAILLSKVGVSFVMQGPPGTGKSQTITNIIAEALADGKTILFVSEKAAALQVVYKRLTEVGLDDFCLALHSHKANKKEILDSIAANLKLPRKRMKGSVMFELTELFQDRLALNQYVAELHEEILPLEKSLYEAFGELSLLQIVPYIQFFIESPSAISSTTYNTMVYRVDSYAKALKRLGAKLSENPWRGTVVKMVTQQFKEDLAQGIAGLTESLLMLDESLSDDIASFGLNESFTWAGAQRTLALLTSIENTPLFPLKWAKSTERSFLLDKAKRRQQEKQEYLDALNYVLSYFDESVFSENLTSWLEEVHDSVTEINTIGKKLQLSDDETLERAESLLSSFINTIVQLNSMSKAFKKSISVFPVPLYDSLSGIKILAEIIEFVIISPIVIQYWFTTEGLQDAKSVAPTAKTHWGHLTEVKSQIESVWKNGRVLDYAKKHNQDANKIFEELNAINLAFSRGAELYPIINNESITFESVTLMSQRVVDLLGCPLVMRQWFNKTICEKAKTLLPLGTSHSEKLISLENWLSQNDWEDSALEIEAEAMLFRFKTEYTSFFKIFKPAYRADVKTLRGVSKKVGAKFSIADFSALLQAIQDIKAEKYWFASNEADLVNCFGELYKEKMSNWEEIGRGIEFVEDVLSSFDQGIVPESVVDIISNKQRHTSELSELTALLSTFSESNSSITKGRITSLGGNVLSDIRSILLPQYIRVGEVSKVLIELLSQKSTVSELGFHSMDSIIASLTEAQFLGLSYGDINISETLSILISIYEERKWLAEHEQLLNETMGALYSGETTNWGAISEGIKFVEYINGVFGKKSVPESIIDLLCDKKNHQKEYDELSAALLELSKEKQEAINESLSKVLEEYVEQGITGHLLPNFRHLQQLCSRLIDLIELILAHTLVIIPKSSLIEKVSEASKVSKTRDSLKKKYLDYEELFNTRIEGLETNWDSIISDLESVSALFSIREASLMTDGFVSVFCDDVQYRSRLTAAKSDLQYRIFECDTGYSKFKSLFEASADFDNARFSTTADRVVDCLDNLMLLDNWISCVETRNSCNEIGLTDFTDKIEQQDNSIEDAVGTFKRGFLMLWVQSVIGDKKTVEQFRRHNQDEKIKRFVNLDEKQLLIAQEHIRQNVISGIPDTNRVVSANDELSILQREIGKKRRIMPLRKLFKSIPNLLLKLKPCMMMSPLSVAYFLEAESYEFDMTIFDEASQIFPQDAVGSIFRSKQVIIAGDSKQLPPTNFFATSTSNDDDDFDEDDDGAVGTEIYDSILEETTSVLPNRTLLWHYRSKHENLIAFSNQEIYKNELVTFPSSVNNGADTGVEFVFVDNGVYEGKGRNTSEARRCVELVRQHIDRTPNRSLGIIAFSESQQKTIALEIQKFREQHPEYESFFAEDREDEFFVKNLENVQGDERDTIIFSVSYAKTKEQRDNNRSMALRFGPLGQKGGERRLNVAITRAKCNVKLVSSILPFDIDLSRTELEGVKMLRQYIEFAMNGSSSLRAGQGETEKDVFLDVVAEYLIGHGYKIKKYVGCSGYKIDLAVLHPFNVDCFVAGIECDGLSYAAAKSARDRDHLRKSVLEAMGWRIYRVWSPEWMARQDIEGQKLLTFIDTAIKEYKEIKKAEPPKPTTQTQVESFAEVIDENNTNDTSLLISSIDDETSNQYGFTEYVEAVWHETPKIMQFNGDDRVAEEIKYIVGIEQPIYIDFLYQRMAGAFGNQKATAPVRNAVERVMRGSKLKSLIVRDKDGFVTLAGFKDLKARVPTNGNSARQINFISLDEIGIAMLTIAEQAIGLTSEGLIDATVKTLGYARKGERMMTCMNNALERLIKQGRIKLVDEKVRIIGGDNRG